MSGSSAKKARTSVWCPGGSAEPIDRTTGLSRRGLPSLEASSKPALSIFFFQGSSGTHLGMKARAIKLMSPSIIFGIHSGRPADLLPSVTSVRRIKKPENATQLSGTARSSKPSQVGHNLSPFRQVHRANWLRHATRSHSGPRIGMGGIYLF